MVEEDVGELGQAADRADDAEDGEEGVPGDEGALHAVGLPRGHPPLHRHDRHQVGEADVEAEVPLAEAAVDGVRVVEDEVLEPEGVGDAGEVGEGAAKVVRHALAIDVKVVEADVSVALGGQEVGQERVWKGGHCV